MCKNDSYFETVQFLRMAHTVPSSFLFDNITKVLIHRFETIMNTKPTTKG